VLFSPFSFNVGKLNIIIIIIIINITIIIIIIIIINSCSQTGDILSRANKAKGYARLSHFCPPQLLPPLLLPLLPPLFKLFLLHALQPLDVSL